MDKGKTCCFLGHREIEKSNELLKAIKDYIEMLIVKENVKIFLFGSKSEFDSLCHSIVTELKEKYPFLKRIAYTCRSELAVLECDREHCEILFKGIAEINAVEEEFEYKTKYVSGKASYVERNQAMIDNSEYCIFYYNEKYLPPRRPRNGGLGVYQPKSGTEIAYKYAERKKKMIKNFFRS